MDSWNPKQLQLMKAGGNAKCATYLAQKGVPSHTAIKQKYESPVAQLYKEVLRARVEGTPEPTELPAATSKTGSAHAATTDHQDPNGMQRLMGETDDQYILRQTRLKEEARQRMAQKFGGSNGMSQGSGSRMAGIGSDPHYNAGAGSSGIDSFVSGFGSALSTIGSLTATAAQSASSLIQDPETHRHFSSLTGTVKATGSSLWTSFGSSISSVVGGDVETDGFSDLQRQMASQRTGNSKYSGFGSDSVTGNGGQMYTTNPSELYVSSGPTLQEAPGMPGEDRNGIERLTGESDDQYVVRQTRLRDEAKARMAAKFGSGGLSSAGPTSSSSYGFAQKPTPSYTTASAPSSTGMQLTSATPPPRSAPNSGSFGGTPQKPVVQKLKVNNADDFFASFGS